MYAFGPKLKRNFTGQALMMTDHYNLVCHLLGIVPNPNNGSWSHVQDMLAPEGEEVKFNESKSPDQNNSAAAPIASASAALVTPAVIFMTISSIYINLRLVRICSNIYK